MLATYGYALLAGALWEPKSGVFDFRPARKAHLALVVGDLDAVLAAANGLGCQTMPPQPFGGFAQAYVFDPFGNRLELLRLGSRGFRR